MPEQPSLSPQETSADLADLPPSAKLVAKMLEYEGDSTQSELAESTLLPRRTVRYALTELEKNGIVSSRISFMDARQRIYSLELGDGQRVGTGA
ncbi:winged helix-turn-helix transcriptional regulator [Halomicroarcula sp. F13]|uniref:Winged helix-turn-helix transcriptional regulator n=1 Tax=Haloarcula rubra TaxID=2487747 RepID=A0AAW4PWE8_9EURY|nr:winged helix-turn-helix transcriptional regulator [Halomicroarcula rubra]MBX0325506.1 winged helix-turn-helix transcriptional regulator [Halomicroarcula rubra]